MDQDETSMLTPEQVARGEALAIARATLNENAGSLITHHGALPKRFGVTDLVDLAEWLLTGTDPLAAYAPLTQGLDVEPPPHLA